MCQKSWNWRILIALEEKVAGPSCEVFVVSYLQILRTEPLSDYYCCAMAIAGLDCHAVSKYKFDLNSHSIFNTKWLCSMRLETDTFTGYV